MVGVNRPTIWSMIRKVVSPIKPPQRRTKAAWGLANLGSAMRAVLASRAGIDDSAVPATNLNCSESRRGRTAPHVPLTQSRIAQNERLDCDVDE